MLSKKIPDIFIVVKEEGIGIAAILTCGQRL